MPAYKVFVYTIDPTALLSEKERQALESRPTMPEPREVIIEAANSMTAMRSVEFGSGETVAWVMSV